MSKHTPGPWKLRKSGDGKRIIITAGLDNWQRLECEVDRDDCDHEMAEANAHLIAAAPDLLAALKESIQWSPYQGESEETDFLRRARAAIKKAEGA